MIIGFICNVIVRKLQPLLIGIKEMIPVIIAASEFGRGWSGKVIQFYVDNRTVVDIINSVAAKDTHLCT